MTLSILAVDAKIDMRKTLSTDVGMDGQQASVAVSDVKDALAEAARNCFDVVGRLESAARCFG